MTVPAGVWVNIAGSVLVMLVGLAVFLHRPHRLENRAFLFFETLGLGPSTIIGNATSVGWIEPTWWDSLLPQAFMAAGLIMLGIAVQRPRQRNARIVGVTIAVAAAFPLWLFTWLAIPEWTVALGFPPDALASRPWTKALTEAAFLFALITWAVAYPRASAAAQRQMALLGSALAVHLVFANTATGGPGGVGLAVVQHMKLATVATSTIMAAFWFHAAASSTRPRPAIAVALVILAMLPIGWAHTYFGFSAGWGITRFAMVLILAYGVLRHQLLDIDVKVKWTLKQSTVAAVFIAVFFIVSEGAAAIFEAQTGSTVAGILAAGALVFAIAPLQRLAERVADKAMPGVKPVGEMSEDERLDIYRSLVQGAYADGAVDASERRMLEELRLKLGIEAEAAMGLEREVAAVRGVG